MAGCLPFRGVHDGARHRRVPTTLLGLLLVGLGAGTAGDRIGTEEEAHTAQLLCFQFMVKSLVLFPAGSAEAECLQATHQRWMEDITDGDGLITEDHCADFLAISAEHKELRSLFSAVSLTTDPVLRHTFAAVINGPQGVPFETLCPSPNSYATVAPRVQGNASEDPDEAGNSESGFQGRMGRSSTDAGDSSGMFTALELQGFAVCVALALVAGSIGVSGFGAGRLSGSGLGVNRGGLVMARGSQRPARGCNNAVRLQTTSSNSDPL